MGFTIPVQSQKRATSGAVGTKRLSLSGNQQVKQEVRAQILVNPQNPDVPLLVFVLVRKFHYAPMTGIKNGDSEPTLILERTFIGCFRKIDSHSQKFDGFQIVKSLTIQLLNL